MKIIAYYTDDDIYSQHALLLRKSLEKFGLKYDIEKIETTNWLKATGFKPGFIENKLKTYNEPLLYVDIDSIFHANIESFFAGIDEDIAVYYTPENELLSGVIYVKPSERTLRLLELWRDAMKASPDVWDQRILQQILSNHQEISIYRLPPEYVFIFDTFREKYHGLQPVIEHLQASRETKYREKCHSLKYRILGLIGIRPRVGRLTLSRRKHMQALLNDRNTG